MPAAFIAALPCVNNNLAFGKKGYLVLDSLLFTALLIRGLDCHRAVHCLVSQVLGCVEVLVLVPRSRS